MESEKVKEIKKVLENCTSEIPCYKCKYYGKCEKLLTKEDILTLINELESENKELKRYKLDWLNSEKMHLQADMEDTEFELFCANKSLDEVRAENKQLKDRIAELEKENAKLNKAINSVQKGFDNGEFISKDCKISALKQLAEKIKDLFVEDDQIRPEIDETLKEFIK